MRKVMAQKTNCRTRIGKSYKNSQKLRAGLNTRTYKMGGSQFGDAWCLFSVSLQRDDCFF